MKIDIYAHILPEKYLAAYAQKNKVIMDQVEAKSVAVTNINMRLRLMDRFPDVLQVLTIANPPLDRYIKPEDAAELAKIANDELAELLIKYPDKFGAAVACVPMNNVDAALEEADRAITQLGFRGVQMCTRVAGQPVDLPQFKPLYEKMAKYDLPIWIHPITYDVLDQDSGIFSWPFETSMAMYHLVRMGIFNDFPDIKFITHHCGAMVPFLEKRIKWIMSNPMRGIPTIRNPEEHFRKFYNDTALYGNTAALMLGYSFFGADHLLFGTDAPLGPRYGLTGETILSVERMNIPDEDKEKIFMQNAVNLIRLPI
jgi:predicted TIM-barrel fold metal-dependent hydrolase